MPVLVWHGIQDYLGDVSAAFRSLYERLIFQALTYKMEPRSYNTHMIPVLFLMTSNCSEDFYSQIGYDKMLENYKNTLSNMVGPTEIMVYGDTLQVNDYSKYNWTMFNPEAKKTCHEEVFPKDLEKAYVLGAEMAKKV